MTLAAGVYVPIPGPRLAVEVLWGQSLLDVTEEGIVSLTMNELAEIHPPRVDAFEALLNDVRWPCPDPKSLVGRIQTAQGGILTYRRAMLKIDQRQHPGRGLYHIVQPAWALAARA